MSCAICERAFTKKDGTPEDHTVFGYTICHLCIRHIKQFCKQVIEGKRDRILWGMWALDKSVWIVLKKFLKEHKIKTVLEYGIGLSTELMVLDGYQVTCLEPTKWFGERARKCVHSNVIIYDRGKDLKGIHTIEFKKKFDLGLVDSPGSKRKEEMIHATRNASRFIFMDNPCANQIGALEEAGWLPMKDQGKCGRFNRFYEAPP